jgi:polyribonucleotide nucleotidyltransferase
MLLVVIPNAENALRPVLPSTGFPFAVRINVELMGVVDVPPLLVLRGASRALKSIGVPISRPVGGVSVGIVVFEGASAGQYELLEDVSDLEEEVVETELQVAGTSRGITTIHATCQVMAHGSRARCYASTSND